MRSILDIDWREYLKDESVESMWKKIKDRLEIAITECVAVKEYKDRAQGGKRTNPNLPMNRRLWKLIRRKKHMQ